MNREIHVRFWEGLRVRFPWATHLGVVRVETSSRDLYADGDYGEQPADCLSRKRCPTIGELVIPDVEVICNDDQKVEHGRHQSKEHDQCCGPV